MLCNALYFIPTLIVGGQMSRQLPDHSNALLKQGLKYFCVGNYYLR